MSDVKCSKCSAPLPDRDLQDGWCNACGARIPTFVYHTAGLKGPKEKALPKRAVEAPSLAMDPDDKPPGWQMALIGLAMLAIAVVIVFAFVY